MKTIITAHRAILTRAIIALFVLASIAASEGATGEAHAPNDNNNTVQSLEVFIARDGATVHGRASMESFAPEPRCPIAFAP